VNRTHCILPILLALTLALISACAKQPAPTPAPPTAVLTRPTPSPALTATPEPTQFPTPTDAPKTPTAAPTVEMAWECPAASATLSLWHSWSDQELATIQVILDEYRQACPNVELQLQSRSDLAEISRAELLGKAGPDIMTQRNRDIGRLAGSQMIVPLDSYLGPDRLTDDYVSVAVAGVSYQDQIYGVPASMETITMIYNKDLIREDELPVDTDDLLKKAAIWSSAHPESYFLVYNARNDAYFSAPWWQAAGVTIVDDQGHTTFRSDAGYAAGNFIHALRQVMPEEIDYYIADTLFKEGKAPMIINGPWYIAELETAGIDFGLRNLPVFSPTGVPAMPLVDVNCLVMTPNAEARNVTAAAVNVMRYLTGAAAQVALAAANGTVPTNQAAAHAPEVQALPVIAAFGAQSALGKPIPASPFMAALWDAIARGVECIWTGASEVNTCVDDIQTLAEADIAGMK